MGAGGATLPVLIPNETVEEYEDSDDDETGDYETKYCTTDNECDVHCNKTK